MIVRAARPGDEPALAQTRVGGWQVAYAGLVDASHLASMSVDDDIAVWESLLTVQEGLRRTLVLEATFQGREQVAGFCSLGPYRLVGPDQATEVVALSDPATVAEIYAFYVRPGMWGTGVADPLMRTALQVLNDDGWPLARLWVLAGNVRARRFYQRHGWNADGERQTLQIPGEPVEVRLQRLLP